MTRSAVALRCKPLWDAPDRQVTRALTEDELRDLMMADAMGKKPDPQPRKKPGPPPGPRKQPHERGGIPDVMKLMHDTGERFTQEQLCARINRSQRAIARACQRAGTMGIIDRNMQVNSMHDTGRYVIEWQGIEASVFFVWNQNGSPDAIQVTVPPGYIAIPPDLSVQEGVVDVVQIYKWAGM